MLVVWIEPFHIFVLCFVWSNDYQKWTLYLIFLLLIECVVGLKVSEFYVFGNEIIVCNDGFKLKYELECRYCFNMLSMTIDAATTSVPTMNFDLIGIGSCQTRRIRYDSIDVSSAIAIPIPIENKKGTKYESVPACSTTFTW